MLTCVTDADQGPDLLTRPHSQAAHFLAGENLGTQLRDREEARSLWE